MLYLLVEDDEVDVEVFKRALRRRGSDAEVLVASDGAAGMQLLRQQISDSNDDGLIIFLDLNMPGINGLEFLQELRTDPRTRRAIVFVLTSSVHKRDIVAAYEKNVAGYFNKSQINALLDVMESYSEHVEFPPLNEPTQS